MEEGGGILRHASGGVIALVRNTTKLLLPCKVEDHGTKAGHRTDMARG
jgi:hypothetical protein